MNEEERCLVPACRRITNTHSFPRYPDQRKKWILTVRNYMQDPKWLPTPHSRICSKHFLDSSICKVYRRGDKLRPNALPIIDGDVFPPNVMREYPKIIPMPKIDPDTIQEIHRPILSNCSNSYMTQTIVVKQVSIIFILNRSASIFVPKASKHRTSLVFD